MSPTIQRPARSAFFRTAPAALAALVTLSSASAWAGPRVGSIVGVPSDTTTTVNARVLSSTPVVAEVAVPTESCYDELRAEAPRSSGAGAILGAIAGAAVGNALGKGSGRALATGVGVIGGAALGNHIELDGRQGGTRTVRRCHQEAAYENQVVAYNVTYEVNGQRYTTQMPDEPGRTIPVQVTVSPAATARRAPVAAAPVYQDQYYDDELIEETPPAIVVQSYYQRRGDRWGRYEGHRPHRGWRHD